MSETPRTDRAIGDCLMMEVPPRAVVDAQEMAKMEKELTAANERAARLEGDKAIVDFLEKSAAEIDVEWDDGEAPLPWPEFSIRVRGVGTIGRGKSIREAALAALRPDSAQKEGKP